MHLFLVYAPDKTDEGATARRLSVREQHLAEFKQKREAGLVKCRAGGAMLSPESITGGDRKMIGSIFFIDAETIDEARKIVESDVYYSSGVWDIEKMLITPFQPAVGFT